MRELVICDTVEPGGQPRLATETRQRLPGLRECLLGQILRGLGVVRQRAQKPVNALVIMGNQPLVRLLVSVQYAFNPRFFAQRSSPLSGIQVFSAPSTTYKAYMSDKSNSSYTPERPLPPIPFY